MTSRRSARRRAWLAAGVLASGGLLLGMVWPHVDELLAIGGTASWSWVAAALACAAASYMLIGLALEEVLAMLGYRLSFLEVQGIATTSTTANYFVSSAGISGFALKAHLLRKRGVPYGVTVTASVVSSAILYIVLFFIIAQGLVYLMIHLQGTRIAIMQGILGLGVLLAVAVPLLAALFHRKLRSRLSRRLFHWLNRAAFLFSKSEIPREDFAEFESQLADGLERIRSSPWRMSLTVLYTCADWALSMATLYFAFQAVGIRLPVGHLSAGFTAGQAATLIPLLPGGLGAVEGSMAGVFQALGVDWERALVAVLLYRASYYFLPGFLSLVVLWGLKVSEPDLVVETVKDILPEELKRRAGELERRRRKKAD